MLPPATARKLEPRPRPPVGKPAVDSRTEALDHSCTIRPWEQKEHHPQKKDNGGC